MDERIDHSVMFRVGNLPALFPAPRIQRSSFLLHHGLKTSQPNTEHASMSALAHYPHREELVNYGKTISQCGAKTCSDDDTPVSFYP